MSRRIDDTTVIGPLGPQKHYAGSETQGLDHVARSNWAIQVPLAGKAIAIHSQCPADTSLAAGRMAEVGGAAVGAWGRAAQQSGLPLLRRLDAGADGE